MHNIEAIWNEWTDNDRFSGVFSVSGEQGVIFEKCCGFRNKSEELPNNTDTIFSIASGTKLFTGLAVCRLIDEKKISLGDKLSDIVEFDLGEIDKSITVFHLLTHTSGIGDYIDEEDENSMERLQELYNRYPVYLWDRLDYYLPLVTHIPAKFVPGARFSYSNSGFVLLGLIVEAVIGLSFQKYVQDWIITPCQLERTGFYRMDSLPANSAFGYMYDEQSGGWRTNIFNLPVLGGSDGGIYTCAKDLDKLWRAVFTNKIFSENMKQTFLKQQVEMNEAVSYGLGVYCYNLGGKMFYYAVGGDFGVDFFTAYLPEQKIVVSALGNTEVNTFPLMNAVIKAF